MSKQRKKYTKEFKSDVVDQLLRGRSAPQLGRELGLNPSMIGRWKTEHLTEMDGKHRGAGKSPSELEAENRELRKQLDREREINTILKKTIKYVS